MQNFKLNIYILDTLLCNTQVGDSAPKEKKKRASTTTKEIIISANKRENAILQTNLFVSKLPPMKLVRRLFIDFYSG